MMGKNDPSKNALKHGAYSREILLPGESRKEYGALVRGVEEEWGPSGPTEHDLVRRLASLLWRQRRQDIYEQAELRKRVTAVEAKNEAFISRRRLKSLMPRFAAATTLKGVEEIIALSGFSVGAIASMVPQPPQEQEAKWGPAIAEFLGKMKIGIYLEGLDKFAEITEPTHVELDLVRSTRLQEEIDRTIKRLVQIKTCKQLLPAPAKMIDVSPNKAITGAKTSEAANDPGIPGKVA